MIMPYLCIRRLLRVKNEIPGDKEWALLIFFLSLLNRKFHQCCLGRIGCRKLAGQLPVTKHQYAIAHADNFRKLGGNHNDPFVLQGELRHKSIDLFRPRRRYRASARRAAKPPDPAAPNGPAPLLLVAAVRLPTGCSPSWVLTLKRWIMSRVRACSRFADKPHPADGGKRGDIDSFH